LSNRLLLAYDKSVRAVDHDGHLRISVANISKATVNPYFGKEIPGWKELSLDPQKTYMLLRDPAELEKAAPTFNGKPLLLKHVPLNADDHPHEKVVGSVGNDVRWEAPYLRASLTVWDNSSIAGIETGDQRELSSAYYYDADMTPGDYAGMSYDGVMRNIRGNHVALVETGRAGSDVAVGDSAQVRRKLHIIGQFGNGRVNPQFISPNRSMFA
jgi:hypothetical protein